MLEWSAQDLVASWTLVGNKTGATRLGFAVLLKSFEIAARFPSVAGEVPPSAVAYLGQVEPERLRERKAADGANDVTPQTEVHEPDDLWLWGLVEATTDAGRLDSPDELALWRLAEVMANTGDLDGAAEIARLIGNPAAMLWTGVVSPVLLTNRLNAAEAHTLMTPAWEYRDLELAHLAYAAAEVGERDRATRVADRVADMVTAVEPHFQEAVLFILAETMLSLDDHARAERFACAIPDETLRAWAVAGVRAVAGSSDDPVLLRSTVGRALRIGSWSAGQPIYARPRTRATYTGRRERHSSDRIARPPAVIASVQPAALTALADELLDLGISR